MSLEYRIYSMRILQRFCLLFLVWCTLVPISLIGAAEKEIYINSDQYPTIYGYYYSENINPNPVQLNNLSIQKKENVVHFPIRSNLKIYILIQNNPSFDNLSERAQREIYLMYLEKIHKKSSFYQDLTFYLFDSSIQEIPFPENKLSNLPTDKSQPENSLKNVLSLLDSKEGKLSSNPVFIVIGNGKDIPLLYNFQHPVFYLQTNTTPQTNSAIFSLKSCGGTLFLPDHKDVFTTIETQIKNSNTPIHQFGFTIPWHRFLHTNTIHISQETTSLSATITPKWSLSGIFYWLLLFFSLFLVIFIFLLLIRFIRWTSKRKKEKKRRNKIISEKKYNEMSINLAITFPTRKVKNYIFNHSFSIGSGPDCTVIIPDVSISLEHAYVKKTKKGFFIIDLQSCNGITVNNTLVANKLLEKNDKIHIGDTQIVVKEILLEQKKDHLPL